MSVAIDALHPTVQGQHSPPLVIGIAGGTASGKTTVARRLLEGLLQLGADPAGDTSVEGFIRGEVAPRRLAVAYIDQDSYYRELNDLSIEERRAFNWDHPDAFDVDLLVSHVRALKAWQPVDKPVYSFSAYARADRSVPMHPAPVVIVEGILVLGIEALRRELDVRIFVDADDDVRVVRRILRDIKERGRDLDSVIDQYFRTVRPMHLGFVQPSKRHADIIIPNGGNSEIAVQMVLSALRQRLGRRL